MPERSVSDHLSEWEGVPFDELLAYLASDMRGDVGHIKMLADFIRIKMEAGKPVETELLQMFIDRILRRTFNLLTILEAVNEYSDHYRANKSG